MIKVEAGIIALLIIGATIAGIFLMAFWPLGALWTAIVYGLAVKVLYDAPDA